MVSVKEVRNSGFPSCNTNAGRLRGNQEAIPPRTPARPMFPSGDPGLQEGSQLQRGLPSPQPLTEFERGRIYLEYLFIFLHDKTQKITS